MEAPIKSNNTEQLFCMKQFKPVIVLIVCLTAGVIGWTTYRTNANEGRGLTQMFTAPGHKGAAFPVATAPPIKQGAALAHPDWGPCKNCHSIIGAKGNAQKAAAIMSVATAPPIKQGAALAHPDWGPCKNCHSIIGATGNAKKAAAIMSVATAPPIKQGAALTHPQWGPCANCHDIIKPGAGAKTVAATMPAATVAAPVGVWLKSITPATAAKFGLENTNGVLVTGVYDPSPAKDAGLRAGDIIFRIDKRKVASVREAVGQFAQIKPGEAVRLQVQRDGRKRKIFVKMPEGALAAMAAQRQGQMVSPMPRINNRIAIGATSATANAQVAQSFGGAPIFIIYDTLTGQYSYINNPYIGSLTAGSQAATMLNEIDVKAVIVGNMGPITLRRLNEQGVMVYTGTFGPVTKVIGDYSKGILIPARGTVLRPQPIAQIDKENKREVTWKTSVKLKRNNFKIVNSQPTKTYKGTLS